VKLGFVFLCFGALILYQAIRLETFLLKLIVLSASVSFLGVGLSYVFRSPKLFLKTRRGSLSPFSFVFFWPYHFMNFLSLAAFRFFSTKPAFHEILPGLFLGCRLFPSDQLKMANLNIQSVLDLTCEFGEVEFLRGQSAYLCIPLLDTTAPTIADLETGIKFIQSHLPEGSVYVHCALGHGRSATFVVAYLLTARISTNPDEAIKFLQSKRSGVKLHSEQMAVIKQLKYE
jgi:hypothetical protein